MTPYLLHETWIDLDHVVLIDTRRVTVFAGNPAFRAPGAYVRFETLHKVYTVFIGEMTDNILAGLGEAKYEAKLDEFIRAWKARSK